MMLFLGVCIPFRIFLAYFAYKMRHNTAAMVTLGIVSIFIARGFLNAHISNRSTGIEVFGGRIWWNSLRPIHALLYFIFTAMTFVNKHTRQYAYIPLAIDAAYGFFAFTSFHVGRKLS